MDNYKIFITGAKVVANGIGINENADSIQKFTIESFFPQGLPKRLAGLDRGSKYLLAAVKESLSHKSLIEGKDVGVSVATLLGSTSSRVKFLRGVFHKETRTGDPLLFKTTVPSVAAGAVSILFHCQGPSITCVGHGEAGLAALHNAYLLLRRKVVKQMIVGGYEDLPEELLKFIPGKVKGKNPLSEGAAALVLENKRMDKIADELVLAQISGVGLCGEGTGAEEKKLALSKAMASAILHSGQQKIDAIVSAGRGLSIVEKNMFPDVPVIDTTALWGKTLGMSGTVGVVTAVDILNKAGEFPCSKGLPTNVLVNGVGISGTAYSVMVSRT